MVEPTRDDLVGDGNHEFIFARVFYALKDGVSILLIETAHALIK